MREGRAIWAKRVERLRDSELTTGEFAAEIGVNPKTLTYWKWRLGKEAREGGRRSVARKRVRPAKPTFVEVTGDAPSPRVAADRIEIVLDGRTVVRVPEHFEAETLRRVVLTLTSSVA
jgi:hypothetical protein